LQSGRRASGSFLRLEVPGKYMTFFEQFSGFDTIFREALMDDSTSHAL
jgi:hypothetical protein